MRDAQKAHTRRNCNIAPDAKSKHRRNTAALAVMAPKAPKAPIDRGFRGFRGFSRRT